MPPEQQDRVGAFEELRRYVSQEDDGQPYLDEEPGLIAGERPRIRISVPVVLALVVGALLAGLIIGGAVRPGRSTATSGRAPTAVAAAPASTAASSACKTAITKANRSIDAAAKGQVSLSERATQIMDDRAAGTISRHDAVMKGLRTLITAVDASSTFDSALADYRQVIDICRLETR